MPEDTNADVPEQILDATCGGRAIWHSDNKEHDNTLYIDKRDEPPGFTGQENRNHGIDPDEIQDYRDLPYEDESFNLIVFDPPHVIREGGMQDLAGQIQMKYGALHAETWQSDLKDGFNELFRVLSPGGTLIFKFADNAVDFNKALSFAPQKPLFGTCSTNGQVETRWFVFYKPDD